MLENIEIIPYEEDFQTLVYQFEKNSAVEIGKSFPESLVKTTTKFNLRFSAKASSFAKSVILIALNRTTHEVIGTVQGVMKNVFYAESEIKILHVFGLKVHQDFAGQGLGTKLIISMEKAAKVIGVSKIYVKVPLGNYRLLRYFQSKLGFKEVSVVSVVVIQDMQLDLKVKEIGKEEAKKKSFEFYKDKDMVPLDFDEIFESPAYIGTFILEYGQEFIGASLWNVSYYSEVEVNRVVIDVKYIRNPILYSSILVACLLFLISYLFLSYFLYFSFDDYAFKITSFAVSLLFFMFQIKTFFSIIKYTQQCRAPFLPRHKIFGVFYSTSLHGKGEKFKSLISHMGKIKPCQYCSFEYHEEDVFSTIFKFEDFCKLNLQKNLDNTPVFSWNKRGFVDPRD